MTRIAVIGNSHVGAVKQGWELIRARRPDVAIEFFGAPGVYFDRLELDPAGRLAYPGDKDGGPASANLIDRINGGLSIDLALADVVVRIGYEWPWRALVELMNGFDIEGMREANLPALMSRPAFDAIVAALAPARLPAPPWRNWTDRRLLFMPRPQPSEACAAERRAPFRFFARLAAHPDGVEAVLDAGLAEVERLLRGMGIALVRQPPSTLLPWGVTADEHSRGARRLRDGEDFPGEDFGHMNAGFGVLCLERILAHVDATAAVPVAAQPA